MSAPVPPDKPASYEADGTTRKLTAPFELAGAIAHIAEQYVKADQKAALVMLAARLGCRVISAERSLNTVATKGRPAQQKKAGAANRPRAAWRSDPAVITAENNRKAALAAVKAAGAIAPANLIADLRASETSLKTAIAAFKRANP